MNESNDDAHLLARHKAVATISRKLCRTKDVLCALTCTNSDDVVYFLFVQLKGRNVKSCSMSHHGVTSDEYRGLSIVDIHAVRNILMSHDVEPTVQIRRPEISK